MSMKKIDLETISVDDLWSLHEQISKILSARITSEKRELEKRLAVLNRGIEGGNMVGPREATALVGCCHKIGSQNRRFQDTRSGRIEGPTPEGVKPDLVQYFILFRKARPPHERPFF